MDFKQVDKKYRPIPFWSWNERLDTEQTRRQVRLMNEAGIGGYFMHARGGLLTEYMGEEWFDNVHAAIDEGAKYGMHSWAYDENGWPSGFGGGKVNGLGVDYQQKSLHIEPYDTERAKLPNTILVRDGYRYYYDVNEFYVDVLDEKVVRRFIDEIYVEYARREGSAFDGFFTDEPQILRGTGYPWSFILEDRFTARYGYSLVDSLDRLFLPIDGCERVRVDYWRLVTELFSTAFFKQIYDWCTSHGYGFTGHLVIEESMFGQLICNGSCMAHYEYFTMPGMDWLGRPVEDCLTPMQVASVAAQTGRKQVLSETFALAGHNVSHAELKRIFEWQMVHGITTLCTHLEGYSLRGIRKRDYPPAMYYQQPWWEDVNIFFDAMSRIGMLLAEGEILADTLLLHPQTTAWMLYDGIELDRSALEGIDGHYNAALLCDMRTLEDKHVLYHLGDETVIERHGRVENGRFIIGKMSYTTLVIPEHLAFLPYTEELIEKFRAEGGRIVSADEVAPNPVSEVNRLSYTARRLEDGSTLHYFVNTDNATVTANITVGNKQMLIETGELTDFLGEYTFAPYESLVLIDDGSERAARKPSADKAPLALDGRWRVKDATYNSLTLDKCDYSFDGELIERDGYVLNILPRINELKRPVRLSQTYRFTTEAVPEVLYLATETPELFEIKINGTRVEKTDCGYFRDSSFRMLDIAKNVKLGLNLIELESTVVQSDACYEHIDRSWTFESMKNCLSYDSEIEPIYLVGDFGLRLRGEIIELHNDAYRISEPLAITAAPTVVDIEHLDTSGFAEFSGRLTLEKTITVEDTDLFVTLLGRGVNSVRLAVNGREVATVMYPPYEVDISEYLVKGENTVTLTLLNNLRNMMGPHHMKYGEAHFVTPGCFYKESNIFKHPRGADGSCHDVLSQWDEDYCLVHFGMGKAPDRGPAPKEPSPW